MIQPSGANYKEDLNKYVAKATTLIHSPETRDNIIAMLGGDDPVQSVASAAVMVMQRIDSASREAGVEVQDAVKAMAAVQIVEQVVEVGTAARRFKLDKDLVELALSVAVQDYTKGEIAAGRMDAQKVRVAMESDMRKMHPSKRKEIQQSQQRIQQTARRYNGGKGMSQQEAPEEAEEQPQGMMQAGQQGGGMMQAGQQGGM